MANQDLNPQTFPDNAKTIVPSIDFLEFLKTYIPQKYQQAPNFMAIINSIAILKQNLYDIIRSIANIYNLYSSDSDTPFSATPQGIYLRMLASNVSAPFSDGDSDSTVFNSIVNRMTLVDSRGQPKSFYNYFTYNNLNLAFNNNGVQEINNATIFFNVPIPDNPLATPNPYQVFVQDMFKLKGAGIKIEVNSTVNIPYFQLADLSGNVGPGNAGFAGLDTRGQQIGGGFYSPVP